jgi:hypothetical protein
MQIHSSTRIFLRWIKLLLVTLATVRAASAQSGHELLFRQDLQSLGYSFKYGNDRVINFSDLAFLSEDMLLVSVRERTSEELHYRVLPSGGAMYDNPSGASTPPTQLSTLQIFDVRQRQLIRSAQLPVQKRDGAVWPGPIGSFLMLSSYGLQRCSADFECTAPLPTDGPLYVSPRGTRAVIGGFQFTQQQLVDTASFRVIETFRPKEPKITPGDTGLLLEESAGQVRMPGQPDIEPGFTTSSVFPKNRFLDDDKVIGITMKSLAQGTATAIRVDGTVLYQIAVNDAWRGHADFVPCISGSRFVVMEVYYTRWNSIVNFFDIGDTREYNRLRIRVFDVATGKKVFKLEWDPRGYWGERILPALSPSGHRLAVVRRGELQVYEIP